MELKWEINRDISEQILHIDIRQEHVSFVICRSFEFIANTRSWYLVKILHNCTTYIWMLSLLKGLNCLCYVCTYSLRMWCNDKRCGGGGLLATSPTSAALSLPSLSPSPAPHRAHTTHGNMLQVCIVQLSLHSCKYCLIVCKCLASIKTDTYFSNDIT